MVTVPEALAFAAVMAAGQFSPGPDMLLILRNSLAHSREVALATVAGISCGIVIHTTAVVTGIAAVSARYPQFLRILWLAGACYLGWLALRLLGTAIAARDRRPGGAGIPGTAPVPEHPSLTGRQAFIQGLITNLTNPKVFLFFTSILAASLPPDSPPGRKLILGGIIIAEAFVLWSLFALLLQWPPVSRAYTKASHAINILFGALLLWIAATVLWHNLT